MKERHKKVIVDSIGIIGLIIIFGSIFFFLIADPYKDNNIIAKSVCEDIGKEMTDIHTNSKEICRGNISSYCYSVATYYVECGDEIIEYTKSRNVHWRYKDCSQRDKWGDCKILTIPKRIKELSYTIQMGGEHEF